MEASSSDHCGQVASHSPATATEPMRNAALELKPWLAQRISAPATPHWVDSSAQEALLLQGEQATHTHSSSPARLVTQSQK